MLPHTAALRRRHTLVLTLFVLVLMASAPTSRAEPADDPWEAYAGTLPHVEADLACVLVRDGRSGAPLHWARVSSHTNWTGSDGWGPLAVADRTDEYGLVRLRPIEGAPLWVVKAPGLGTGERFGLGALQHTFDLWPAPEVHGRIVDVRGRPVAGAQVEWTSEESRHGPSLGLAVTDANGLWRMRVPAERSAVTLVSGPRIRQTWSLSHAPSWAAAPIAVALPGRDVEGRIVGRSGAMGHLMVSCDTVRGPCGSIDADGRFRVPSCNPNCSTVHLHGYTPPPGGDLPWLVDRSPELGPRAWTPGRFIVWDPDADPASTVGRVRDIVLRVAIAEGGDGR